MRLSGGDRSNDRKRGGDGVLSGGLQPRAVLDRSGPTTHTLFVVLMALELTLPLTMVPWQAAVASRRA
jgi:hypothetical protein